MNRYSNAEGWIKPKGKIRQTTVLPAGGGTVRFDGGDTCGDLELSNFSALDSNVKNMVSKPNLSMSNSMGFCPKGFDPTTGGCILYPSASRVPNRQQPHNPIILGGTKGRLIGRASFDGSSNKSAPKLDYNADGEEDKVAASTTESSLVKPVSVTPVEKKILGMKPKVAYGVGAAILIAGGAFVYFKYFKK